MNSPNNSLPTDVNMVGGTMPGLMFYAGFMQGLFNEGSGVALDEINSISGTSAGAFIAAMTAVGHHQALLDIILNEFGSDTGKDIPWLGRVGVLGEKTIQGVFETILDKYITAAELEKEGTPKTKTLHLEMDKGLFFSATENLPGKEVLWLIGSVVKDQFFKIGNKFANSGTGYYFKSSDEREYYGDYKIFDSSKITEDIRDNVANLVAASGKYAPENRQTSNNPGEDDDKNTGSNTEKIGLWYDGESGSWQEASNTSVKLLDGVGETAHVLLITRHPEGSRGHNALVRQSANIEGTNHIISPDQELLGGISDTNPENMKHNFNVGQRAAQLYLEALRG